MPARMTRYVSHLTVIANEAEGRESQGGVVPSVFTEHMVSGHFIVLQPCDLPSLS